MSVERAALFLAKHAPKLALAILVAAVLFFLLGPPGDPVKAVDARCNELKLPVHIVTLEPGSKDETRFLLIVPKAQRVRLPDGRWKYCRMRPAHPVLTPEEWWLR